MSYEHSFVSKCENGQLYIGGKSDPYTMVMSAFNGNGKSYHHSNTTL